MLVISRADSRQVLAFLGFDDDGFARGANSRIDNHYKDRARGIVRRDPLEKTCSLLNRVGSHLVRDIHDARIGRDAEHHRFADGHRVIGDAEIGHEDNRRMRDGLLGNGRCIFVSLKFRASGGQGNNGKQR